MLEPISLGESKSFKQLTLGIVGKLKSGKSRLASTGRKSILFLDYDLRSESLAGRPGVYAIKMVDPPLPNPQTVIPNTFDIMSALEKSKKVCELAIGAQRLFPNAPKDEEFKTVVFDSAQTMSRASLNFILSTSDKAIRYEVKAGSFVHYSPNSWTGWVVDTNMVESILLRCIATGLDTIFVLHEVAEESVDSTEKEPKFTGRVTVYPVRYGKILGNLNEVWRMQLDPDPKNAARYVPRVRVTQDWNFNASTCMQLDPVEAPDIEAMLAKHDANTKDK